MPAWLIFNIAFQTVVLGGMLALIGWSIVTHDRDPLGSLMLAARRRRSARLAIIRPAIIRIPARRA